MKIRLPACTAGLMLAVLASACGPRTVAPSDGAPAAPAAGAAATRKPSDDPDLAKYPDVIGIAADQHGPHITIWVNGDLYFDTALRDNEEVAPEQLGNYLVRIVFANTKKVRINAVQGDAKKAKLTGKLELLLAVNKRGRQTPVLKMTFAEMRLARSRSESQAWTLTAEGIALIEMAIPQKQGSP